MKPHWIVQKTLENTLKAFPIVSSMQIVPTVPMDNYLSTHDNIKQLFINDPVKCFLL